MENAGRGDRRHRRGASSTRRRAARGRDVAIVCGAGTNGGDGFVAARHLARAGVAGRVALTAPAAKVRGDAAVMLAALERMGGVPIVDGSGWTGEAAWRGWLADAGVVVDAIFGTGFHGAIAGVPARGARRDERRARAQDRRRRAVGPGRRQRARRRGRVPRRRDRDDGRVQARSVRRRRRAGRAGRGRRARRSDPDRRRGDGAARSYLLDEAGVAARLPRRRPSAHKGSSGHLLVVAGSPGKTGRGGAGRAGRRCARAPAW